jgi:hypothetical protein
MLLRGGNEGGEYKALQIHLAMVGLGFSLVIGDGHATHGQTSRGLSATSEADGQCQPN